MQIPFLSPVIHYFRVFHRYAGYRLHVFVLVSLVAGLLAGLGITMMIPLLSYDSADRGETDPFSQVVYGILEASGLGVSLFSILVLIVLIFLVKGGLSFLQIYIRTRISTGLEEQLRINLAQQYQGMSYHHFCNTNVGYLNNLITSETVRAVSCFVNYCNIIVGIIYVIVFLCYSVAINWQVTAFAIVAGLGFSGAMRKLGHMVKRLSTEMTRTNAQVQQFLLQMIANFKYLKATSRFPGVMHHLTREIRLNRQFSMRGQVLSTIPAQLVEPVAVIMMALLVLYLVGFKGDTLISNMVTILICDRTMKYAFKLQADRQRFANAFGGLAALEKAEATLAAHREIDAGKDMDAFAESIELRGVGFSYGDRMVLEGIDLAVGKNESIGIVGESGSGKTTLLDIITGLFAPQMGTITIDGVDYREIRKSSLRRLFGYVTQEPVLFNDTIENNISFWDSEVVHPEVERAAITAGSADFIKEKPAGFDTVIGDGGIRLSGGQKQRLAIAREVYRNPQIMIFDEATSALDSESERYIQQSIQKMRGERTLIIIAHRLTTVRSCDKIIVLSHGRVIEQGTWNELIQEDSSTFHVLCRAQGLV
ncbi:MAG: ABC transporter ATP-binding protein [Candidatus Eisenbacteria sp.]|nr:ABC transporter ATP-binding protein [Candidatus Eisenbacteria bacterium]